MKNNRQNGERIRLLRLVLSVTETNAAYNQFSLPMLDEQDITICTFFRSDITPPEGITLIEGDDSFAGFFRALNTALARTTYEVIHAHTVHVAFLFLMATIFRRKKLMPATVYTLHNSFQNYKPRNKLLCIPVFFFFRRVVCCGRASLASVPAFYKWLAGSRLRSVCNGVNIDRVDHILGGKQRRRPNGTFTITSVGRLIDIKNPRSVLKAFQKSADTMTSLIFIGEGELRGALLRTRQECNLEKQVQLTGLIPRNEVYRNLADADLFVSASRGEGLPIAALEAMACGCPVILSDISPHREIADGADFIPLVSPGDVEGLAWEICRFKQMSVLERADIGKKGRELVDERFSLASMHQKYAEIYREAMDA